MALLRCASGLCLAGIVAGFAPLRAPGRLMRPAPLQATTETHELMDAAFSEVAKKVDAAKEALGLTDDFVGVLESFLAEYVASNKEAGTDPKSFTHSLGTMVSMVTEQMKEPFQFQTFHEAVRVGPVDLYKWGNEFFRPLMIPEESRLEGKEVIAEIAAKLAAGENVMFLSNHQTEADPQVISLLFEDVEHGPSLAEKVICIAGHRVTTDPLAIPFSMGRNLLTIHSKKHINNPPDMKEMKQRQNMETMNKLGELLTSGGRLLWVAPSGGRDRPGPSGDFEVAPFDPKSVTMFQILGKKSGNPLTFYPMAMFTHQLVPPPKELKSDLGETRSAKRGAARVAMGPCVDPEDFATSREAFADEVHDRVSAMYASLASE